MSADGADRDAGLTQIKRSELYQDRWTAYGSTAGILELSERPSPAQLRKFALFEAMDDRLLEEISQDVSVVRWKAGAVLFEEGSYIDVAFFVAEGQVDIFLAKQQQTSGLGAPIFDAARTMVNPASSPSTMEQPAATRSVHQAQIEAQRRADSGVTYLSAMDFDLPSGSTIRLGAGEVFGEIGALSGWPQSVTARTASECVLVQIRLPALRRIKDESKEFKARLDQLYRERSLFFHLRRIPLFENCDDAFLESLAEKVDLVSSRPRKDVVTEGEAADALYLVRSGFLKLSQKMADGQLVVSYISKGMTLGELELLVEDGGKWTATATSVGYAELVKIDRALVTEILKSHPDIEQKLWQSTVDRIKESGFSKRNLPHSALIEFSLDRGLVQGNSILVIDLNTCTRCDDCVRACADTHGGRPRFIREGERYGHHLIARSCYHCRDPVCLVGCPTGAIHRANVGDVVEIQEDICIGCTNCATKCPYDVIVMHSSGEKWPADTLPEHLRGEERKIASKCDLCYGSNDGPACVKNCPHGSAVRVGTIEDFQTLFGR